MPVVVQCFHCNAVLELDDGFRGGVCRCSTCGSLLQVPKGDDAPKKANRVRPAVPPRPASPQAPDDKTGLSSGAFDPRTADPGLSSGLARIHKTRPIAMTTTAPAEATPAALPAIPLQRQPRTPRDKSILMVSLVLILLMSAVLVTAVVVFLRQNS